MIPKRIQISVVLISVIVLALVGCSREAKKGRYLERGQARFEAGDYDRAEIEYLNVLRIEPTNQVAIRDLGIISLQQGRLARSLGLLNRAYLLNTNDLAVRLQLGLCELTLGGLREARKEAEFVLDREPTNGKAMLLLVESSGASNELANAQKRLTKLEAVAADIPEFHLALGSIALRKRDLAAASAAFQRALALDRKSSTAHGAMGNLYLLRSDRTNAEAEFKAAAELAPLRSPYRIRYANLKAANGDTNSAKQLLEDISKKAPDYLPALLRRAELALAARDFQNCEQLLKSVLQRDKSNLEGMQITVQLHVAQGDLAGALAEAGREIREYPRVPQLHYRKAVLDLANNDLPAAVSSLNKALDLEPIYPEAVLLLGQIYVRKGNLNPAITLLTTLLHHQPGFTPARILLATAYRSRGDLDKALKIYQDEARSSTNSAELLIAAGLVQRQLGRNGDARKSFEKALSKSPEFLGAMDQLIGLDLEERHFDAAKSLAGRAVQQYPKAPQPLLLLARVYLAETNLPESEAALLKAVGLAPDFQDARRMLARIYIDANRYEQALTRLQEVVSQNTNDVNSWYEIAHLQTYASNYVAARNTYEKILEINPKFCPALNNLAWLYAERLGDPSRAYEVASQARAAYPNDPYTADTLGWICYRRGEYAFALTLVQQCADKLPNEPEILFHLGMIHYSMGHEAAARAALQGAVRLGPGDADWRPVADEHLKILAIDPASTNAADLAELKALASRAPKDAILQARQAAVSENAGDWNQAAQGYERALTINSNLVPVMVKLARLYTTSLNDPKRALSLARRARDLDPDDVQVAHTLGWVAFSAAHSAGDFNWAYSLLQECARHAPADADVLYSYALSSYAVGDVSNAVAAMQKVVAAVPPSRHAADARLFLDMYSLRTGESTGAESRAKAVLQQQPDYVPALLVTGMVEAKQGNARAARDAYERILAHYPSFAPAWKPLALLYAGKLGEPQKAYDFASKARETYPGDVEIVRLLGGLAYQRGEFSSAIQWLKQSTNSYPTNADLFYMLGLAQRKLELTNECRGVLARALALDPNSPFAPQARSIITGSK